MFRKTSLLAVLFIMAFSAVSFAGSGTSSWFDMETCAFCKNMTKNPELLKNMTWEHYNIANGIISVTTVNTGYMDAYKEAMGGMGEVEKLMQKGEKVHTCQMCAELGDMFTKGAKWEMVETKSGMIGITTATDPALVTRLQAWSKRTTDEMVMMEEASKAEQAKTTGKTTKTKSY